MRRALIAILVAAGSTHAGESFAYHGTTGFSTSFYLIGGTYQLYVYAKRPVTYTAAAKECLFNGVFEGVSPAHDALKFGLSMPISTIVPYKLGPTPITLPAGLYHLLVASLTDCDWHFSIESTQENPAGLAPVMTLKRDPKFGRLMPTASAVLGDTVAFYAAYRTDHGAAATVSGTLQLIYNGQVVRTFALVTGPESVSGATTARLELWFYDPKYLGKNTIKFIVKIGSAEFTSTGEITVTPKPDSG
ncbi:MAG TPA: hypothetical protein VK679_16925 [Gemmatimonadaceae bacterium]|nr:hypothetical protein [Gemmatimonadaceae bacterium]